MTVLIQRAAKGVVLLALLASLAGCMGWLDIFSEKRQIDDHFFLQYGEGDTPDNLYLFIKGNDNSIAGPLRNLGWNDKYIIFIDANWPKPWNAIDLRNGSKFTITEAERASKADFESISILQPSDAWLKAKH